MRSGRWSRAWLRVYRNSSRIGRDELMQEGVVGLLRALERYDPERGVPFWGYAAWWVRQAMQQVVSELSGPVVLSDRALRQLARIKAAQRRFAQTCRRDPATAELSAVVGLPQAQVESLLRTDRAARGLDEPTSADAGDGMTIGELVVDPPAQEAFDRTCERVTAAELPRLLLHLTARERNVICCRYGLGRRERTLQRDCCDPGRECGAGSSDRAGGAGKAAGCRGTALEARGEARGHTSRRPPSASRSLIWHSIAPLIAGVVGNPTTAVA